MIERIIEHLRSHANPANVAGMARYGINSEGTLGVPVPLLRRAGRGNIAATFCPRSAAPRCPLAAYS
jgi:hypothetical protein